MATNINISVAGHDLVERSKQQQRDARTNRLTLESITKDATTNSDSLLRDQGNTSAATSLTRDVIDSNDSPYIRVNRPAASRAPDSAFLLVTNLNYVAPDPLNQHRVRITSPSGEITVLAGVLDSSMVDFMNRTYLFLPLGKTLEDFKRSVPYSYIYATLDLNFTPYPEDRPRAVTFIEPMRTLRPVRPVRNTKYTIELVEIVPRLGTVSGNVGAVMAGYLNTPTYYISDWFTYEREDSIDPIVANNVQWGVTNPALAYRYPPGYPL
jgi:hypothetical protein